ncbi:MAG: hypothetical protein ABR975_07470 [Vulcanimicrobiaceae bacterium]
MHAARVGPGEYAVETEVTVPLDEVDVRIDGLAGHWIYNPGAPHAVLVVPDERDAIGISVVGTARNGKTATACGPSVGDLATGAAAAKIVADVGSSPQALSPFDYGVDDPPTCAHPFLTTGTVRAGLAEMPSPPASGIVGVKVELDEHSTIVGASVWSTTNAYLNAGALVTARASTFQTQVWRCIPTKSSYLFTVDYYVR